MLFASHASQQLLGEPPAKLIGDGLFERVHIADRPAFLTALSKCSATGDPITVEFRLRQQSPSGGERYSWVEMRCRPLRTPHGGAVAGVLAGTRDISERKAQEDELLRARDEAESASRAKTQFLASMSHELRTPLNAVIGFSEILNRELFGALGEQRYRDYARMIHESGEHLLHVVNDILDMSKIEAGKFKLLKEPFDVGSLVRSCADVMRHAAEAKQLTLITEVPSGLPELVADNGIGIAEHDLPKLGHPIVQADNAYNRSHDGAGLGLSVVQGLARLHEGRLEIASKLGQGTTATIVLPMKPQGESDKRSPQDPAMTAA